MSSFSDCQKHEDIIVKALVTWKDEDITVSPFSLYYTWRNNLRLYNRIILGGNSKSAELKWQKCRVSEYYYITSITTVILHFFFFFWDWNVVAYLEPSRTSMMDLFGANGLRLSRPFENLKNQRIFKIFQGV